MTVQESIDSLIGYIDSAVARSSVSNRHVATVLDFLNQKQKTIADCLPKSYVCGAGSQSLPVYFTADGHASAVTSVHVPGSVVGECGIAAGGIASTESEPVPFADIEATAYDDLDVNEEEDLTRVASAYAVAHLKADIGIAGLTPFSEETFYHRGDTCRYAGLPFRFISDKPAGPWQLAYTEQVTYKQLLEPIGLLHTDIDNLINS